MNNLPPEIIRMIATKLNARSYVALMHTNRFAYYCLKDEAHLYDVSCVTIKNAINLIGLGFNVSLKTPLIRIDVNEVSSLIGLKSLTILQYISGVAHQRCLIAVLTSLASLDLTTLNLHTFNDADTVMTLESMSSLTSIQSLTTLEFCSISFDGGILSKLAKFPNLISLTLHDVYFDEDIVDSISLLKSLTSLDLCLNDLPDIAPLSELLSLTTLDLSCNCITDISPLANLLSLTSLNLSSNNITDISPLANLLSLIKLDLGSNNITNIDALRRLPLKELRLEGNPCTQTSALANNQQY